MENLLFCLNATLPVFLVMVVGYLLRYFGLLDPHFVKTLNAFNYKITLPMLLFRDISQADFSQVWDTSYVLFCFIATLISITVSWIGTRLFLKDVSLHGEFIQGAYRSSAAVLGIALIQNIYGDSSIAPLMIIGSVPLYNAAAVVVLSFNGAHAQGMDRAAVKKTAKDILTSPIILSILLGIVFSLLPFSLPVIVTKTVNNFAVLASPLALIGLGAGFEGKKAISCIKPTIICSVIKLLVWPAVFMPLAVWMGFSPQKLIALLIMLGAPTTVSCYIMAKNLQHEGALTSSVVVSTTFFSSVTLTFWLFVLRSLQLI
ncbi:MAG: AEC family transporter [Lachnospiraceae bacterium]|nr:AEC family transporter [Lachnospiraceae bacterium]